jgi:sterol desaturase/sphingolipid hydroxylase (fatty acid hydroxylase superfamily)
MTQTVEKSGPARPTPISIMGMSGLKPIIVASTGMALVYALGAIAWSGAPLAVIGIVLLGLFAWTFLEYHLHRFVLHWEPEHPTLRIVRKCFPSHRPHHNEPLKERMDIVTQLKITVGLTLVFTLILVAIGVPIIWVLGLLSGILLGYQAYEYVHVACHHLPMRNPWARTLKRHHGIHHHRDETVNFGVTTTIWDYVFFTVYRPGRRAGDEPAASEAR